MGRRICYNIAGQTFDMQADLISYLRRMIASYPYGARLCKADTTFILDLIALHPDADHKIGCGIAAIEVRRNPVYTSTRTFWLIREDGSETDVSWKECLRATPHDKRFLRALRVAIAQDIDAFRDTFFRSTNVQQWRCPYTGELLTRRTAHVDHQAPHTFEALAEAFVHEEGINIKDVVVNGKRTDNAVQDTLADPKLTARWIRFHRRHARLQVVSRTANLSLLNRGPRRKNAEEDHLCATY